jgi:hypothetical protein
LLNGIDDVALLPCKVEAASCRSGEENAKREGKISLACPSIVVIIIVWVRHVCGK